MSFSAEHVEPSEESSANDLFGIWVFACFAVIYGIGASVGIQGSDSSEFVLASISNSRVHPPGYPILVLWLKCFQWLSDNPVWNTSFATALLSACSMGFVASALRYLTRSKSISLWLVMIFGVQPLWLRYSTIPEAFAILGLVYSILIWTCIVPARRATVIIFSLAMVIGIGSHHLFVLAFPLVLWNIWKLRKWWIFLLVGVGVGFLSYGYLLIQSGGWGDVSNIHDLLRFFFRIDYGTFQITHTEVAGNWWETPLWYLMDWGRDSWWLFPIFTLISLRSIEWFGRDGVIGLSWILSSVFVLSLFGLPTTHAYLVHSNRFFMAPSVLVLPFVALGLQVLQVKWKDFTKYVGVAWIIPMILFSQNFVVMGRFDTRMQDWLEYSCSVLPQDSLVFVAGDGAVFGMKLGQQIIEDCRDIDVVFPKLLLYEWYRAEIASKNIAGTSMLEIIQQQTSERSIFSVLGLSQQTGLPPSYPYSGVWMRYVPHPNMLPHPEDLMTELSGFQQHYPTGIWNHSFFQERSAERWPSEQWAHSWWSLSDVLKSTGDMDSAQVADQYGRTWLPK